jgi:4'-phosphopantetheinyl transferase
MTPIPDPEWVSLDDWPGNLNANQLHIWRIALDSAPCRSQWLSRDESLRFGGTTNTAAAHRFCAMRCALRRLLGGYCGIAAADVTLVLGASGKPLLAGGRPPLFNLSHSHGQGLVAFSLNVPLGVDLEYRRPLADWQRIARRMFDSDACSRIEAAADPLSAFYRHWTALEARQKCFGQGIFGHPVASTDVGGVQFTPATGHVAALAWSDPGWSPQLRFLDFDRLDESAAANR